MDNTRFLVRTLLCCLAAIFLVATEAFTADRRADRKRSALVVVHSEDTPPLSFNGLDGAPKGVLFDFWTAWSATTGIPIRFVQTSWPDSLQMMRDGRADVHAGMYFTQERDEYLDFTVPLFSQEATLFVRASLGITDVAGLRGRTVAVLEKGFSESWLRKHHPELKRRPYKNSRQMVEGAMADEVDALLTEYTTMVYQLGATDQYKDFVPLATLYEREIRGATAQGKKALVGFLNRGIHDMGEEGRTKVLERWVVPEDRLPSWLWPALGVGALALLVSLGAVLAEGRRPR